MKKGTIAVYVLVLGLGLGALPTQVLAQALPVWEVLPELPPPLKVIEGTLKTPKGPLAAFFNPITAGAAAFCAILFWPSPLGKAEIDIEDFPDCERDAPPNQEGFFFTHSEGIFYTERAPNPFASSREEFHIIPVFSIDDGLPGAAADGDPISSDRRVSLLPSDAWPGDIYAMVENPDSDPDDSDGESDDDDEESRTQDLENSQIILVQRNLVSISMDRVLPPEMLSEFLKGKNPRLSFQNTNGDVKQVPVRGYVQSFQTYPLEFKGKFIGNDGNSGHVMVIQGNRPIWVEPAVSQEIRRWANAGKKVLVMVQLMDRHPFFALIQSESLKPLTWEEIEIQAGQPLPLGVQKKYQYWLRAAAAEISLMETLLRVSGDDPSPSLQKLWNHLKHFSEIQKELDHLSIQELENESLLMAEKVETWFHSEGYYLDNSPDVTDLEQKAKNFVRALRLDPQLFNEEAYGRAFVDYTLNQFQFIAIRLARLANNLPFATHRLIDNFLTIAESSLDLSHEPPSVAMESLIEDVLPELARSLWKLEAHVHEASIQDSLTKREKKGLEAAQKVLVQLRMHLSGLRHRRFI